MFSCSSEGVADPVHSEDPSCWGRGLTGAGLWSVICRWSWALLGAWWLEERHYLEGPPPGSWSTLPYAPSTVLSA